MSQADHSQAARHSFWLASRGTQQMDLALRFAAEARARDARVLALKGISIADELHGGVANRPMADIDFLVVDTKRFEPAAEVARSLGLVETGASDHALVFRETASGAILELHLSLTTCPGLFTIDHDAAWERRAGVASTPMFRLANEDLVVHLALHTAFQHGFVAGEDHAREFVRALEILRPPVDLVLARAKEWGATAALGAMASWSRGAAGETPAGREVLDVFKSHCPKALRAWPAPQTHAPAPSIAALARVRYALAPSKWGFLGRSLFPKTIPGRTTPGIGDIRRLANLLDAGLRPSPPPRP